MCRLRAVSFLAAAAKALNALVQRLSASGSDFNDTSLLEAILSAHSLSTLSTESLAALTGELSIPGTPPLLQVWLLLNCVKVASNTT